jgi:hypothetical protein
MCNLAQLPSSSASQNLCSVIEFIKYLADDIHRLKTLAKTSFPISICVSLGAEPLCIVLLWVLIFPHL